MARVATPALAATLVVACASTPPLAPPQLAYSGTGCADAVELSRAAVPEDFPKRFKRMERNRTLVMDEQMGDATACLRGADGVERPYSVYRLPQGLERAVVTAGGTFDDNSIFAPDVRVLDASGQTVRTFEADDYGAFDYLYGVQFPMRPDDAYVVVAADPAKVGEVRSTSELRLGSYYVSNAYGGGGQNVTGSQVALDRTFAYDGSTLVRVVFPKQPTQPAED